jgi:hypothetical protein
LLAACLLIPASAAAHADPTLRGFGTAVIDASPAPGEWDSAGRHDFMVSRSAAEGGGTVPATLYVMNDAVNLYAALRVSNASVGSSIFRLYFDNDHSAVPGRVGDDGLDLTDGGFRDLFVREVPPAGAWSVDASYGGTTDGEGLVDDHAGFSFYELSHPLDSSDNSHDISLQVGARVGFDMLFQHCVPYMGCGQVSGVQSGDIVRVSGSRIPPDTAITVGPADGSTTADSAPEFEFTGSDEAIQPSLLTFECKTDEEGWRACSGRIALYLDDGRHTFYVRALDDMLNADLTPAQRTWTVDTTGPSKPVIRGRRAVRRGQRVVVRFSARDELAGGVRFRCAVDSARLRKCPALYRVKLRVGRHVLRVKAVDRLGNESDPATFRVRVKRR